MWTSRARERFPLWLSVESRKSRVRSRASIVRPWLRSKAGESDRGEKNNDQSLVERSGLHQLLRTRGNGCNHALGLAAGFRRAFCRRRPRNGARLARRTRRSRCGRFRRRSDQGSLGLGTSRLGRSALLAGCWPDCRHPIALGSSLVVDSPQHPAAPAGREMKSSAEL